MPKTWFITGTTSGFGERLVRQNLARGDKVITGSRNATKRAQGLIELGAHVVDLDLSWEHTRIVQVVRQAIDDNGGHIDYLFSVAGYGLLDAFEEVSQDRLLESLQVNLHGHINVTRAVLPYMRAQRSGRIAVMSSAAGWVAPPGWTPYAIAKFGLEGFITALSFELEPLGIQTLLVEPGSHRTNFGFHLDRNRQPRFAAYDAIRSGLDEIPSKWLLDNPGNPDIAVRRMIEVLTSTGFAAGKTFPARLPLGKDALAIIRSKCVNTLKLLLDWEPAIVSSDDRPVTEPFPVPAGTGLGGLDADMENDEVNAGANGETNGGGNNGINGKLTGNLKTMARLGLTE